MGLPPVEGVRQGGTALRFGFPGNVRARIVLGVVLPVRMGIARARVRMVGVAASWKRILWWALMWTEGWKRRFWL
jgi:hypothetical protein